ncbi:MAG: hypothetical protein U1E89_15815 [Burkholderiaceae bacterium]
MSPTLQRWFARMPLPFRTAGRRDDGDAQAMFDHVDGHCLGVGEFRASGSMEFHGAPDAGFADTLPAWAAPAPKARVASTLQR